MASCKACFERGQTWSGSAPKCAFLDGVFSSKNWNCATMNELRDLCGGAWDTVPQVDRWACRDDMSSASFGALWVPDHGDEGGFYVAMSWYKNRGATGQAYMFCDDMVPHPLTVQEAEHAIAAIKAYRARKVPA
jgi:hypothetical protein